MDKIFKWVQKHPRWACCIIIAAIVLPFVIVHVLFNCTSDSWFAVDWGNGGDVLAYISGAEALIGTLLLGYVAIYQNKAAQRTNEQLQILQQAKFVSVISVSKLYHLKLLSKNAEQMDANISKVDACIDLTADDFKSESPYSYVIDVEFQNDSDYPVVELIAHPGNRKENVGQFIYGMKSYVKASVYMAKNDRTSIRFIVPSKMLEKNKETEFELSVDFVNIFNYITPATIFVLELNSAAKKSTKYQYRLLKFTDVRPNSDRANEK